MIYKQKTIGFQFCLLFVLLSTIAFTILGALTIKLTPHEKYNFTGQANKCILFIGDGMGEAHVKTAEAYFEKKMSFTNFPLQGYVTTNSLNLVGPTDSAAAASALATGLKYQNGVISLDGKEVKTICDYFHEKGLGVGIITTDNLAGATPAGFSAHAKDRGDTDDIIRTQLTSEVDLFIGSGTSTYTPYLETIEENGYQFITSFSELAISSQKIIATFEQISYHNNSDTNPTLSSVVEFAYQYFETNYPDGYFMMIEGAHIDKRSHDNNITSMVNYLNAFDEAINLLYNHLKNDNYFIMVTADHETGHLDYQGESKGAINNQMYKSTSHTSRDVPYYISTSLKDLKDITPIIDNTEVFQIYHTIIKNV